MGTGDVVTLMQEAIKTLLMLLAPLLGTGLAVGLLVSLFQATIQLNEQSLPFTLKLVAVFGALFICGTWLVETLVRYTIELYQRIPAWM